MLARVLPGLLVAATFALVLGGCPQPGTLPDGATPAEDGGAVDPPIPDANVTPGPPFATPTESRYFEPPAPGAMTDLYVSPSGSDANPGTRERPLRSLWAAWRFVPATGPLTTGVRINLARGRYPFQRDEPRTELRNLLADRRGTATAPIVIQSTDGQGAAVVEGGLSLRDVHHLRIVDVAVEAGGNTLGFYDNNVIHLERCDTVLLKRMRIVGVEANFFQEVLKVNQAARIYVEDSEITGCLQTGVDFVAVQHGHLVNNRIHGTGDWCAYFKGGTAYFRVEGNELWDCPTGGFSAGEGTGIEFLEPPWLQFEAYDIKVVNNVVHDTPGSAFGVYGGFNILIAHNTAYRVGYNNKAGASLVVVNHGARACGDAPTDDPALCIARLDAGAWGHSAVGREHNANYIPSRNVYVFNNVFYNPAPARTQLQHFLIAAAVTPPPTARNVPSPAVVDDSLLIRGNLVWNGPRDMLTGASGEGGCLRANPLCNDRQIRAQNTINEVEPQLANPAMGDYRPRAGSNVLAARAYPIPPMPDARPPLANGMPTPAWTTTNTLGRDRNNAPREPVSPPGAYAAGAP